MSLYRQPGRRSLRTAAVAALTGLLVGLAIGLLAGGGGSASLSEAMNGLRERLAPASSGLELVVIEYGQAVRGGRVVAPTEHEAARSQLRRARVAVTESRPDLAALDPAATRRLVTRLAALARLVDGRVAPEAVEAQTRAAQAELQSLLGQPDATEGRAGGRAGTQ